jgi:hypothetical protein
MFFRQTAASPATSPDTMLIICTKVLLEIFLYRHFRKLCSSLFFFFWDIPLGIYLD